MPCWSSSSTTTIEEANSGLSHGYLWARAVMAPLLLFAGALALAYALYRLDPVYVASSPWRLLVVVSWTPYMTLGFVVMSYMDLSLQLAPVAARNALLVVTCAGGILLMMVSLPVYAYGHHASACIPLACVLAVQLAGLLALWLWLHRTYRSSS
ncbi:hypothetical protein BDA96_08G176800 [Sorghum bicolor]|uniref:DUF7378 domain-containing protein n=1 Tax=Sorghum bicolor TaxID=4558 RepID=A0A921U8M6_SORBI|nr:hypothetical protein BDA96_08G176800 [Sorghum bicolor]